MGRQANGWAIGGAHACWGEPSGQAKERRTAGVGSRSSDRQAKGKLAGLELIERSGSAKEPVVSR